MEIILKDNGKEFTFTATSQDQKTYGMYKVTVIKCESKDQSGVQGQFRIFRPMSDADISNQQNKPDFELSEAMDMLEEMEQNSDQFKYAEDFLNSVREFLEKKGYLSQKQKQAIRNIYEGRR